MVEYTVHRIPSQNTRAYRLPLMIGLLFSHNAHELWVRLVQVESSLTGVLSFLCRCPLRI
jgi:hypothetical protein